MKDNIIVLGANGMLGHVVSKHLSENHDVTALTSLDFHILYDPLETLEQFITDNTRGIINCAGVVKPRIATYDVQDVFKINSLFPIQLSKLLANKYQYDIFLIHISTDCVFTGNKGPYTEEDIPDSTDIYGISKAIGEVCAQDSIVIRTSIIGEELHNKYSLLEWAKSQAGKEISGWTDHIWSGVTTLELAKYIEVSIEVCLENDCVYTELIHYVSKPITKFKLLTLINEVYGLKLKINKVDSGSPCNRSLSSYNDNLASNLKLQLKEMKEWFNEHR